LAAGDTSVGFGPIIKQFLISALRIREEYYPTLPSINGQRIFERYQIPHIDLSDKVTDRNTLEDTEALDKILDAIIERHFVFK
jgi:hypothetical protein